MKIKKVFAELVPSFDLGAQPEIMDRLAVIGRHFDDAEEMARMTKKIYDKLGLELKDQEQVLLATLVHDIGKSGPADFVPEERKDYVRMFPHAPVAVDKNTTVRDFLTLAKINNCGKIIDRLAETLRHPKNKAEREKAKSDLLEENIFVFWRRHVDFTYDVLKNNPAISQAVTEIASSHHILEGKNPADLPWDEVPRAAIILEITDKYQAGRERINRDISPNKLTVHMLTVLDKYQAFRRRSALTHQETVKILRIVVEKSNLEKNVKEEYQKVIAYFENSEAELDEVINSVTA